MTDESRPGDGKRPSPGGDSRSSSSGDRRSASSGDSRSSSSGDRRSASRADRSSRRVDAGSPLRVDRRSLLRVGAVGAATALAGCNWGGSDDGTEPDDAEPTDGQDADDGRGEPGPTDRDVPHASEYGTVVDVVADGGADPTGEESIRPVLDEHAGDDTLLYFPEGRYLLDDIWRIRSFEHLGVVGEGATIVPQSGYLGYLFLFGLPDHAASDLLFEGLHFDFTDADTVPRPVQAQVDDGLEVRDISVEGATGTARFDVTSPDGEGVVRNLRLPDGGMEPHRVGVLVGPANEGFLRFENCHVEGFPGNGLYASPSNGPIEVVGGLYANNDIASVRVSSPATVRDVTVRCDRAPSGFENMRGIRLRHGESALVENCRIEMSDLTHSDGGLVIEPMMESATVRNLEIDCSVDDVPAVRLKSPRHDRSDAEIELERVTVTGDASQRAAVEIADRRHCILNEFDIQQVGVARDGVHLIRTTDSVLRNSEIDVTGDPLVLEQSQLRRVNNRL